MNHPLAYAIFSLVLLAADSVIQADDTYGPADPVASIDGKPIYLGELNLILVQRLGADKLKRATVEIQQAAAVILLRRHLAMQSLRSKAADTLDGLIKKDLDAFAADLKRRGSSLSDYARQRFADERSLSADLAWRTAWRVYLKSRMTDENLRKYFEREKTRYAGGRWNVSQVFLKLDVSDPTSVAITTKRMQELADEIRTTDSIEVAFATAAREYSDAGSAEQGGMIGWVQNDGDLPKQVMQTIRELKVGEVSSPIRSPLGMHLLLLHEHEAGKMTFDQLTDQSQLKRDAADTLFESLVRQQKESKVVWHIKSLRPPIPLP